MGAQLTRTMCSTLTLDDVGEDFISIPVRKLS